MTLIQRPDGTWAEDVPTSCTNCDLPWPWDGTKGRVIQGHSAGGGRWFECQGCGFVTGALDHYRIGMAPDGEAGR